MPRGNPELAKKIFQKSREISENRNPSPKPYTPSFNGSGGAFSSMSNRSRVVESESPKSYSGMPVEIETIKKVDISKYYDILFESLSLMSETKEYAGVVRNLLTFYLAGNLNDYVVEGIKSEDKKEILGIIEDFKMTIKNYLK